MSEKTPREQIALLKNVIEDLQERVQTASESIGFIVQALDKQHDEAAQPDFERLRYESEKQAYEGHPAARSTMPELYFLLLVSVLTAADATQAQWRHLYRTASGAGYEADVRDLLPDAYSLTDAKLIETVESIKRDELTNAFVLDCILLALLQEGDAAALLAYIADLFALLGAEKEVVSETMQAAKTIVTQDREAYLAAMADMSYLDARESCRYLFHSDIISVMNDLVQPEDITSKHLIVVGLNETNIELNLDTWKAEKITFRDCIFENSKIASSQKEVHFIGCTFHSIVASTTPLTLSNTEMTHCFFKDCTMNFTALLNLSNSTITDSNFIRCYNEKQYMPFSPIPSDTLFPSSYLIIADKSFVLRCTFSGCKTTIGRAGSAGIITAKNHSSVEYCQFEQCTADGRGIFGNVIISLSDSTQTDNTFHDCSCDNYVR